MKNLSKFTIFLVATFCLLFSNAYSQNETKKNTEPAVETVKIKTSAICSTCKKAIERAVKKLDGIDKAKLDVDSKILTVSYINDKTNPAQIRKAVSKAGYDADNVKADQMAYEKLPKCCKKDAEPAK